MDIRILVVDDHAIVRSGLIRSIQQEPDMDVVGEISDGRQAVEAVRALRPDVVVMDITMPELNGIEATRLIRRESPPTQVVALSMHSAKRYVQEMLMAGAAAYLLKQCDFSELTEAIRAVARGQMYISPAVSDVVIEACSQGAGGERTNAFAVLTLREREVLQLVAEGNTTKKVAIQLHISPKTVEAHRLKVMQKLDIDNIPQLTKYAIQEGLTTASL